MSGLSSSFNATDIFSFFYGLALAPNLGHVLICVFKWQFLRKTASSLCAFDLKCLKLAFYFVGAAFKAAWRPMNEAVRYDCERPLKHLLCSWTITQAHAPVTVIWHSSLAANYHLARRNRLLQPHSNLSRPSVHFKRYITVPGKRTKPITAERPHHELNLNVTRSKSVKYSIETADGDHRTVHWDCHKTRGKHACICSV